MPRKTVRNVSGPSSDAGSPGSDEKIGRPEIEKLAAEEEIKADTGAAEGPDVPKPGDDKPRDLRKRCPHGRLFQCRQCDSTKGQLTPEEREKRRQKIEDTVGQVYNAVFNLAAVITGENSLRLSREERHALETTGASTVEEVAPAVSLPILAAVGHAATLAGLVAGKIMDLPKEKEKKIHEKLDAAKGNGTQDAEHTPADRGGEAAGKDDARPPLFKLQTRPS